MKFTFTRRSSRLAAVLAAASLLAVTGCSSSDDPGTGSTQTAGSSEAPASEAPVEETSIDLVGFAVIQAAYDDLAAGFAQTDAGAGVTVKGSFGASGAQSRAVIAGQDADLVALSLTPDVDNIVKEGLIPEDWNTDPQKGIVSDSVVVIAVRKGNPKNIQGWDDIVKDGVGIVTADPGTSGSAKWNLLGAYTHGLGDNNDKAAAEAYLQQFIDHVVSWNDSGRTATDAFVKGTGDVLISYENEAIAARAADVELDYVVPDSTFLIENPAATTTDAAQQAKDFLTFVRSDEGQQILVAHGFRSPFGVEPTADVVGANDPSDPFPAPARIWTVEDLGGWSVVNDELFGKEDGLVTQLRG
ncbi:sulfate ABC transporter substrate-binding protein [Cellulomonas composti]|uniref:Sulfate ABC transporter substrate-binding protein n=1 Tax=Cellulomonas composti TaxID=266130 RepID=A0A511JDE6_9CELL|nr:sulfate ABC transporter substrate-binding protein [Cellulomonas composti]GEL96021.1 sulfate ABC transporter substrate-binding protein [Cellulomonas composti]